MGATEEKIALIIEAYNKTKGAFTELDNALKGVSDGHKKLGAESESMFSKMKANWVAMSVAVAEVGVAINKAWEYMEKGAKAEQAESAFRSAAAAAGESADGILDAMKRAAAGTVDDSDIMQKAVKGLTQGLSGNQLVNIMEAARVQAIRSGQDVTVAYEQIVDAIANNNTKALKTMGLVTKEQMKLLNEAMALGITDIDMYSIAMENAAKQQNKLTAAQVEHAEKMQRWKVIFNEVKEAIGKGIFWIIDNVIGRLFNVIANVAATVADLFARIGALWSWMTSGFSGGVAELSRQMKILDEAFTRQIQENNAKYGGSSTTSLPKKPVPGGKGAAQELKDKIAAAKVKPVMLGPDRSNLEAWKESQEIAKREAAAWKAAEEAAVNYGLYLVDLAEQERSISKAEAVEKRIELHKQMLGIQEEYLTKIDRLADPAGWYTQQNEIIKTRQELLKLNKALQEQTGTFLEGFKEGFAQYLYDLKTTFQEGVKLAQDTAQAMEQAFSDFFFDVMTNKLKSFSDYVKSFLEAIARAIANMMAQQATASLLGSLGFGSGAGAGAALPASGGNIGFAHSGGLIMHAGGYVPRFHVGGLSSDEVPAILQKGEYVVSRKGVAALDKINSGSAGAGVKVQINIENQTGQPVEAKQTSAKFDGDKWVIGVVMQGLERNYPFRQAIAGVKR